MTPNEIKNIIQKKAVNALIDNNGVGLLLMATGTGKTKTAIDYCRYQKLKIFSGRKLKVLIIVPTTNLRDNTWLEEIDKWGEDIKNENITIVCYASINKLKDQIYDLVILDEAHHITPSNSEFLSNNSYASLIALTATYPKDEEKIKLLEKFNIKPVYEVTLDQAVEYKLVSPYKIRIVEIDLDDNSKYITAGNKNNNFLITERADYDYITKNIKELEKKNRPSKENVIGYGFSHPVNLTRSDDEKLKFLRLTRMRKLYNYSTKAEVAEFILKKLLSKEQKTLIFASNITQAKRLCAYNYHSKSSTEDDLKSFCDGKINRLSCVGKLNEGINIPNIDNALIVQLNSNDLNLAQRINRYNLSSINSLNSVKA